MLEAVEIVYINLFNLFLSILDLVRRDAYWDLSVLPQVD